MNNNNNNTLFSFPTTQQPDYNLAATHRLEQHQEETTRRLYFSTKTGSTPSTTLHFRILVANDISKDVHNILKIAQSMGKVNALQSDPRIDAVLLTGGLASPSTDDATSKTTLNHISNKEGEVMTVLSRFEQIKKRVFYIPGPSDPISLYARDAVATTAALPPTSSHRNAIPELNNQPPHLTLRSVNVHNWWVELEEGVIIAGVGDKGHDGHDGGGGTDAEDKDNGKHFQSCQQQCHTVLNDAIQWWQEKNNRSLQEQEQLAQQQQQQQHAQGQGQGQAPEEKQQQEHKQINGATPAGIKHPQIIFMTNVVSMKDVLPSRNVPDSLLVCVHGGAGGRASSGGKANPKPDLLKTSRSALTVPIIKVDSLSRNGKYSIIDFSRTAIEAPWKLDRVTEHDVTT